jgi:hypothetical protein
VPYIKPDERSKFDALIKGFSGNLGTEGELNYVVTSICQLYLKQHGLRYAHLNAVIGALECAKQELYRRIAAPYEDDKIRENGDVRLHL